MLLLDGVYITRCQDGDSSNSQVLRRVNAPSMTWVYMEPAQRNNTSVEAVGIVSAEKLQEKALRGE